MTRMPGGVNRRRFGTLVVVNLVSRTGSLEVVPTVGGGAKDEINVPIALSAFRDNE